MISIRYRLQLAAVPLGEDLRDLRGVLACAAADQIVRFGDQLHVGVLDAVVHHLHEVSGAVVADVRDARLASATAAIERRIGPSVTQDSSEPPGMIDGPSRAPSSPPGDAGADEVDAGLADRLLATDRVGEVRVCRRRR